MGVKRYPLRLAKTYRYTDPETGEKDDILFVVNGALFPLFKSLSGVELGDALSDYKKSVIGIVNKKNAKMIAEFCAAETEGAKFEVAKKDPNLIVSMLRAAHDASTVEQAGFSLIELLLISTHICALPESERGDALAAGLELLPDETYQDISFAFEILQLVVQFEDNAKKNSDFIKMAAGRRQS